MKYYNLKNIKSKKHQGYLIIILKLNIKIKEILE